MKNNNNLCAIIHNNFDRLHELTNNYNKATLLDKIIYWWQISTYKLEDGNIWFTRCLDQIALDSKISKRSVERYLQEFSAAGLISKTYRLFKKKHLYIRVTEKLLKSIEKPQAHIQNQTVVEEGAHHNNIFFEQTGVTVSANLAASIYKEKDLNSVNNSTVSEEDIVNNFEPPSLTTHTYPIESTIGERITERLKNYIKGMLTNVQKQYDLKISNPNKLFAEVVFSVTQENQWQGIDNPHHRVNIIAKLLRQKQWRTPKGFYNHWDVGQFFRKKEHNQLVLAQKQKMGACATNHEPLEEENKTCGYQQRFNDEYRFSKSHQYEQNVKFQKINSSLKEISLIIQTEESYLKEIEYWFKNGKTSVTQEHIELVAIKIARLYDEKQKLISSLENDEAKAA